MLEKLLEVLQSVFTALLPFTVVPHYQQAVRLRLGKFKDVLEPGFHWIIPLHFDVVLDADVKPRTSKLIGLSTTTKDGKSVGFDAVITWSVANIRQALLEVHDLQDAVNDTCAGAIGTELANSEWDAIWHGEATENLTRVCRKRGWKWGIEISAVQLMGIAIVKNLRISSNAPHTQPTSFTSHDP